MTTGFEGLRVWVAGTVGYNGTLVTRRCVCCPDHLFWAASEQDVQCAFCLNDEDAPEKWKRLKAEEET